MRNPCPNNLDVDGVEPEEELGEGCELTAIEIAVAALLILAKLLVSLLQADPD